jgi:branched-chain amino acid transport system substrate-binding protein
MISLKRAVTCAALTCSLALGTALPAPAAGETPYEISVIVSLTGAGAFLGLSQQKALTVFESSVNAHGGIKGRPLQFVFLDDQTSPQVAVQLANQVLTKRPAVVLGSSNAATCRAIAPLFANGPVNYCLIPAIHPPRGYVFSASVDTRDMIATLVRYFRERGWTKIARVTTNDASGQDADDAFADALALTENKDVTIVSNERYNLSDVSTSAQFARIKASGAQAIIIWATGTPFGTALHGLRDSGLELPVAASNANMVYGQMKQYEDFLPKELYFEGVGYLSGLGSPAEHAAQAEFLDTIKAAGILPDFQTGMAWDPALIVVDALRKLGPGATAAQLQGYIEQLGDFPGISGRYNFRDGSQRGLSQKDLVIMRWDDAAKTWKTASGPGGVLARSR